MSEFRHATAGNRQRTCGSELLYGSWSKKVVRRVNTTRGICVVPDAACARTPRTPLSRLASSSEWLQSNVYIVPACTVPCYGAQTVFFYRLFLPTVGRSFKKPPSYIFPAGGHSRALAADRELVVDFVGIAASSSTSHGVFCVEMTSVCTSCSNQHVRGPARSSDGIHTTTPRPMSRLSPHRRRRCVGGSCLQDQDLGELDRVDIVRPKVRHAHCRTVPSCMNLTPHSCVLHHA